MVEVHPCPEKALSDGHQSLAFPEFDALMREVRVIALAIERPVM
jgi:3-deoxy-7-phosphoheptulonate synthase